MPEASRGRSRQVPQKDGRREKGSGWQMSDKYTTARLTKGQDHFEILVKPQPALDYKLGKQVPISQVLLIEEIYSDSSKGTRASEEKLQKYFGSTDPQIIAEEVMKSGELQLTTAQRRQLREEKRRQIVTIITRNAIDPRTGTREFRSGGRWRCG